MLASIVQTVTVQLLTVAVHFVAAGSGDFAGDRRDDVITQYHEMKEKCVQSGKMANVSLISKRTTHMHHLKC